MRSRQIAIAALLCCAAAVARGEPPEAATLRVYQGPEGQSVEVLVLKPVKQGLALVRVKGTGSPFDGLVLDGQSLDRGSRIATTFHGDSYTLMDVPDGSGHVWFSGAQDFPVKYSAEASRNTTAAELIAEHAKQLAAGDLAVYVHKEYPHLVKKYEAKAAAALAELSKACPAVTAFTFQWSSFSDEDMDNLDAWALCQPLITAVRGKCGAAKAKLVCKIGPKLDLSRGADALTFTTTTKGATDGAAFLSTQLGK